MASQSFQVFAYLKYWLDAVDEHSLHSPFFFDFYRDIIKRGSERHQLAEKLRHQLEHDNRQIKIEDLGSKRGQRTSTIREIARSSVSRRKYSEIYARMIQKYNLTNVIELGTSFGINTLYLATSNVPVYTFEGSDQIATVAEMTFEFGGCRNVHLIRGNIDTTLPHTLQQLRKVDFAFIDANHTYEATMRYFQHLIRKVHEKSIIVIDDIHYSTQMQRAWREICKNEMVYGSADLFRSGVLFFEPSLNKQHVILQM